MGSRKKVKPNPSGEDSNTSPVSKEPLSSNLLSRQSESSVQKNNSRGSWYGKSWPRGSKAAAVTEVARESIAVAGILASEPVPSIASLPETPRPFRTSSIQLTKRESLPSRSLPANATTTKINIASNGSIVAGEGGSLVTPSNGEDLDMEDEQRQSIPQISGEEAKDDNIGGATSPPTPEANIADSTTLEVAKVAEPRASWLGFGWIGWGNSAENMMPNGTDAKSSPDGPLEQPLPNKPLPSQPIDVKVGKQAVSEPSSETLISNEPPELMKSTDEQLNLSVSQKRSWLQMWGGNAASSKSSLHSRCEELQSEPQLETEQSNTQVNNVANAEKHTEEQSTKDASMNCSSNSGKSSGWAFWSRESVKPEQTRTHLQATESGDLVGGGSPSLKAEACGTREVGVGTQMKDVSPPATPKNKAAIPGKTDRESMTGTPVETDKTSTSNTPVPLKAKPQDGPAAKQLEKALSNQLLPSFRDTFAMQESPSWLQSLGRLVNIIKDPENKHVMVLRDPPRPKRALAIGVHGYFPGPMIRTVIGQPTGTSLKFSTMAAQAIHQWVEKHNGTCEVKKISLEGEGFIADRVDILWKLLLNWLDDIRKADFIMFACHSQGVPVTIMLVAKLIAFGCISASRMGICAMAGVNLGPFPEYKTQSRWIGGSAGELFDFGLPHSKVSHEYEAAIEVALNHGVRITFVGSIDDQLVSLESSLFAPVSHPYIYRAVFVDGRVHAPSFLSHLVGFILKLRNLGISDHGLLRELSQPLAGSLYTGEGHSRLHDEQNLYYLAVEFALETSNVNEIPLQISRHRPTSVPNPYILPFAMRGILEEDHVRRELQDESMQLLKQFDDWKPATKVLKDVKFRLEGIRSKL